MKCLIYVPDPGFSASTFTRRSLFFYQCKIKDEDYPAGLLSVSSRTSSLNGESVDGC